MVEYHDFTMVWWISGLGICTALIGLKLGIQMGVLGALGFVLFAVCFFYEADYEFQKMRGAKK